MPPPTNPLSLEQLRQSAVVHLQEFRQLREQGRLCKEGNELFANDAVDCFFAAFRTHGEILENCITLLAEISTLDNDELATPGQHATFQRLIEPLSDSFDPEYGLLYDTVMAQLIDTVRRLPKGAALNAMLLRFEASDGSGLYLGR
jgi:hypothetical protein